ncbi:sn-glycerol-3-phosphate ABC transporter substrate-binding protein UgpB [Pararhizobium haloflavum]|uniref:sn-glycerol-3-phosphate ABC transporter substrate-binding protein UgpB n=1 Tax=Pararhizobium haloflavum TaxID=2037914 RepID=UPI000C1847F3|nr:sn-glycerol-3-phosphate ABC transporter substrate-binding protein UgpB [Pararhizobium haloflavum]
MTRLTLAALAATTLLTATPASAQVQIDFWHAFTGRLAELLDAQVAQFNESQSDYQVVAAPKGNYSEALNAGIAAFRAGEQPHILQVFEVGTASMMAAEGAVKPVFEVMEEAGADFDPDAYLAAVTGYYSNTEGEMLSYPYNSSTPVMYINRDAFEEAGLDPDMELETWAQVEEAVTALKEGGSSCPFTTAWQSWVQLESFSAYHNLPFSSQENGFAGFDTELQFNGPEQIAHIAMLGEWTEDGRFIYAGRRNEAGQPFRAGECAIMTESSAGYAGVKDEAEFAFDIRPLPYNGEIEDAPYNTIIGGASLWVLEGHEPEKYEGVAAFLNFLSTPEIQAQWHQDTGYLPITTAAYTLSQEQGFYEENPGTDIAIIQMTGKEPTPNSKGVRLGSFDQVRTVIDEELEAVWAGDKTAEEALNTAVERGNQLLRRFEQANR